VLLGIEAFPFTHMGLFPFSAAQMRELAAARKVVTRAGAGRECKNVATARAANAPPNARSSREISPASVDPPPPTPVRRDASGGFALDAAMSLAHGSCSSSGGSGAGGTPSSRQAPSPSHMRGISAGASPPSPLLLIVVYLRTLRRSTSLLCFSPSWPSRRRRRPSRRCRRRPAGCRPPGARLPRRPCCSWTPRRPP